VSGDGADIPFTLPRGYKDAEGRLHRQGVMRSATAMDEVAPLQDHRVRTNPGYLAVILLSRVVTRLGDLEQVYPQIIEGLPVADFAFLQSMYRHVNGDEDDANVKCPHCGNKIEMEAPSSGEF